MFCFKIYLYLEFPYDLVNIIFSYAKNPKRHLPSASQRNEYHIFAEVLKFTRVLFDFFFYLYKIARTLLCFLGYISFRHLKNIEV